ncbi:MAG: LytTR family transcriptional regulator DNA-binding domain-containing protein [Oscillospiraceae bacterium]|nr:LytTR family transcriptional regulator DNA-binding domain-containing protein [Oscillospiraceae bacterium]
MELNAKKKITAAVCTGSAETAQRLARLLRRWAESACVHVSTARAASPDEVPPSAELLFLDMDSVSLPAREALAATDTALIVVSGDAGNAIRSYRYHPAAFLRPEFGAQSLSQALDACERAWQDGRACLETMYHRRPLRVPVGRVRFVEANRNYCVLNQNRQSVKLRLTLCELERAMPQPPCARCHKSYLVHLGAVEAMSYTALTLRGDGARLPLGRAYHDTLRAALEAWQKENAAW